MSTDDPTAADVDPAIRVHVSPSQASYFAGEQFSVTITFTNTRTPESPKVKHSHRRGVHSISSAPLARPPTSPGIPRPAALTPPASAPVNNARDMPTRKRLIGQVPGKTNMSMVLEQKRQSLLEKSRSLSIDIPATDLPPKAADNANSSASRYVRAYNEFSDSGHPPAKSPLTRSPDFPLPPHHPHARKQSVADMHFHLNEVQQPSPTPPLPAMVSSSGSTFSLALDPIAETPTSPYPGTPFASSPSLTESLDQHSLKTASHAYPPRPPPARRPSQLSIGHGHPPSNPQSKPTSPLRNGTLIGSNSELILYSYAQLLGTVSITPLPGVAMSSDQAQTLAALRLKLLKRTVVGGGSMDITSHQRIQDRRRSHNRSASLTSSFLSLLSPSTYSAPSTPLPSSQSWAPGRPRTPSVSSVSSATPAGGQQNGVGLGLINGGTEEDVDPDVPLPTFDVQPAMLAVDLTLGPGESRTYTYTVALPDNLPPTFRGRALKFSYELVIGTCRANPSAARTTSSLGPTGANSISRVMKVPIRVYNHVAVGKAPRPYDLLWPVGKRVLTMETAPKVMDGALKGDTQIVPPSKDSTRSLEDLRDYGRRLLATFSDATDLGRIKVPLEATSPAQSEFEREREGDGGALTGCREAVEILTRNPKKVSYDVNKDGVKVAVLTFTKSAYRLGETVLGVVELNERQSRSRVLSLSAMLESQETLPSHIASAGNLRHTRRVHAEHHASLVSSVLRTTFSLDIPSDASPAFQVQLSETDHTAPSAIAGGLVWRVRLSLLVAVAAETSQMSADGVWLKQLAPDGPAAEWGTPYRAYPSIAPRERPQRDEEGESWAQYFVASFLGTGEREYHDGDEVEDEDEAKAVRVDEDGWKEIQVETVECEVGIKVWPGNTAFKAMDVVFDFSNSSQQGQDDDDEDRKNRFLAVTSLSVRERAASQPPHTDPRQFLSSHHTSTSGTRMHAFNTRGLPSSVPTRSSSFSNPQSNFASAMRESRFASTVEDDESEALSDTYDDYVGPSVPSARGRSYASDLTRSRSQSLAATTRPGPIASPFQNQALWSDVSSLHTNALNIPGSRYGDIKPPGSSRYGSLGTMGRSPLSNNFDSHIGGANGYSNRQTIDASNMSPFVRDVGQILLDDGSALRQLWAGMNPPKDESGGGGGSGTTSRRHSVSVVQPRRPIVGFNAPGNDPQDESSRPNVFHGQTFGGRGGLMLSDDDLAADLGSLSVKDGPGPSSSTHPPSQPSSLPIYAPMSRSPPSSDRVSPYKPMNVHIPSGTSFASTRQHFGSPSDSGLSAGGSPPRSHFEQQIIDAKAQYLGSGNGTASQQQQQSLTARFIPGQGIQYLPSHGNGGSTYNRSSTTTVPSPLSPTGSRAIQPQQPPFYPQQIQRRTSDAPQPSINDLGKGVPLSSVPASWPLYIVEFKAGRTDLFYLMDLSLDIRVGDLVIVEADRGKDLGKVVNDSITLEEVEAFQREQKERVGYGGDSGPLSPGGQQGSKKEINPKMIYGKAQPQDTQHLVTKIQDEMKALQLCQSKVRQKKLPMEVIDAEYQWDRRKLTFYFVAEKRIDFRELVRELFRLYKTRIWMASLQGPGGYEQ